MRIPLSLLPEHLKIDIVEKQDIRDFLEFHLCSQESYKISKKINARFEVSMESAQRFAERKRNWDVHGNTEECECCFYTANGSRFCISDDEILNPPFKISIKKLETEGLLSGEYCEKLKRFFVVTNSTSEQIVFSKFEGIGCTVDQFNRLVQASRASYLSFRGQTDLPMEFLRIPAMKQIESFNANCLNFNDDRLLTLKSPKIHIMHSELSNAGINRLLKEWLRGEREISFTLLLMPVELEENEVFLGIPYSNQSSPGSPERRFVVKREIDRKKIFVMFTLVGFAYRTGAGQQYKFIRILAQ